ncbi:MAG TPA: GNAT family N-acetyltransferase [Trebonia sp.]
MVIEHGNYELDDNRERVDREAVWKFLSTEAYWGKTRTRDDFETQFRGSWRVVGAYEKGTGRLVGFAQALSDGVANAYLADVFVLKEARGHGLGKELVAAMIDRGPGADFRWMLHTSDAHGLYLQFGFLPPDGRYLERPRR